MGILLHSLRKINALFTTFSSILLLFLKTNMEKMNPKKYDIIVIGAGYAGLTAAALLQKKGHSVALLEAHTEIGGCASFYDRDGFRFEAGATTISGIKPHQPFGKLFDELSINPELIKMDPGVVVHLAGDTFNRPADPVDLLQASEAFFGKTTIPFWQKILKLEETAYQLSGSNSCLPPYSLGDYLKLIRFRNLSGLPLLPALFTSTETVLQRMGLAENTLFRQFVEEQLMITAQNTSSDTPFLTAALALAYPNDTYYPVGGMTAPAQLISDVFQRYGGTLLLKEQVTAIIREANSRYLIRSKRGN
ncbi:partial 1-hydroxycarotenoid 3,4-desaturase, partial [Anaerolineae bacterium]